MTLTRDQIRKLQKGLAAFGFHPGPADGILGPDTEDAVTGFQSRHRLLADGIAGPATIRAFNAEITRRENEAHQCLVGLSGLRIQLDAGPTMDPLLPGSVVELEWVRCPADKFPGRDGYNRTTLRSDTAVAYKKLYEAVHLRGGIITSAGGKRPLATKTSASRSKKSFHYTGRAFDLALPTGMKDPDKDPFIMVRVGDTRRFNVWCRSSATGETKSDGMPVYLKKQTVEASYVVQRKNAQGKKYTQLLTREVTFFGFDFTALARLCGFESISARKSFFKGGSYLGAEWWHFSFRGGMVPGKTTFGEELLRVYTLEECRRFIYWEEVKNAVYGVDFFG